MNVLFFFPEEKLMGKLCPFILFLLPKIFPFMEILCLSNYSCFARRLLCNLIPSRSGDSYILETTWTSLSQEREWAEAKSVLGQLVVCGSLTLCREDFTT